MRTRQHPLTSCSRTLLVLAGLLYLLGAAADPLVHAFSAPAAGAEVVQIDGSGAEPSGGEAPAHAEAPCLICKTAGPVAYAPLAAALSPTPVTRASALLPPSASVRTWSHRTPTQPRAPPHV